MENFLAGERFEQKNGTNVFVNLLKLSDGRSRVTIYDADAGGPIDEWVNETYAEEAEGREAYEGRLIEVRENSPHYVANVWGGGDE